jgi:hypothetical protein
MGTHNPVSGPLANEGGGSVAGDDQKARDAELKVGVKPADGRMIFLLQHPLRRRLLGLYVESEEPLSPKELADYVKAPLDHVACHVRVLAKHRAVGLVETRPVRGAVEHFYAATGLVDEVPWARAALGLKEAT